MYAKILIATTQKELRQDQLAIIRRVMLVLVQHNMDVELVAGKKLSKAIHDVKLRKVM